MTEGEAKRQGWFEKRRRDRAQRALERQREYQEKKAASLGAAEELTRNTFLRAQVVRQKIAAARPVSDTDKILEVGSGAHGLIFGFGTNLTIGIDPLAADYRRLFPQWQANARTAAAAGEHLPFADRSFDIVMSDNVIDHAEDPVGIIHEIVRVLKPGGALYFTVNVHHPVYETLSRAHGLWNAAGIRIEISPFADHTVHFSEQRIREVFRSLPLRIVSQASTAAETRKAQRAVKSFSPEALFKKMFFKNALFETVAVKDT